MVRLQGWLILGAAVAAVAINAVWLAPAALVEARLARATDGMLRLERAEGTVWRGRAVVVAGSARMPVAWRIGAWPLLRGDVRLHVLPDGGSPAGSPRADITITGDRVAVNDASVSLPAAFILAAAGLGDGWVADGEVNMTAAALDWSPPSNGGAARIVWHGARILLPTATAPVELGDVVIALAAEGDRLSGPVANDGGDLAVSGEITARAADSVQVRLVLAPRRADDAALARMLAPLAAADGGGWRLEWRRPLR